jgi:coenzyme PQQ precursor peptide PqqA
VRTSGCALSVRAHPDFKWNTKPSIKRPAPPTAPLPDGRCRYFDVHVRVGLEGEFGRLPADSIIRAKFGGQTVHFCANLTAAQASHRRDPDARRELVSDGCLRKPTPAAESDGALTDGRHRADCLARGDYALAALARASLACGSRSASFRLSWREERLRRNRFRLCARGPWRDPKTSQRKLQFIVFSICCTTNAQPKGYSSFSPSRATANMNALALVLLPLPGLEDTRVVKRRTKPMAWTTPVLVEICIGLEINGYLSAEF